MKLTYITSNPFKFREAKTCAEAVAFTAKYGADKLGRPCLKSDTGLYLDALGGGIGTIATESRGKDGRWHDFFYIPDGDAIHDFAKWYQQNALNKQPQNTPALGGAF